ncbi:hypothetical protein ACWD6N_11925 [Micromonospora sp. NPDC005163]
MSEHVDGMLRELEANLDAATHPFTSASIADRVYEAYVFSLVVAAALDAGAAVSYREGNGKEVTDLVFRGAPGVIYSSDPQWTFAVLGFGNAPPLEVHVRVKIIGGKTRTEGECDVLILDHHAAASSRYRSKSPPASKCLAVIECKFYPGPLPVSLAREFAQLCHDRGNNVVGYFVSNQRSAMVCQTLAATPNAVCEFGVLPGTRQKGHLTTLLREAFKRHVAPQDPTHVI